MKNDEEIRKVNKRLKSKVNYLQKKVGHLQFRLYLKQARIDKLKEIMDLAMREKVF